MKITEILHPMAILPTLQSEQRDGILLELAEGIQQAYQLPLLNASEIGQRLVERERISSTGIGEGLAIPHCRLAQLTQTWAVLGIRREGVLLNPTDEQPTYLFVALISPTQSIGSHLRSLARICRLFKGTPLLSKLLMLSSRQDIYDAIVSFEQQL